MTTLQGSLMMLIEQARAEGDTHTLISLLANLGSVRLLREGDATQARLLLDEALMLANSYSDFRLLTLVHRQWGNYGIITSDYPLAIQHLHQAVDYAKRADDRFALCLALSSLCHTHIELKAYTSAWDYAQAVHQTAENIANQRMILFGLTLMGVVKLRIGDFSPARDYFSQAMTIQDESIRPEDTSSIQNYLAHAYYGLADFQHARQTWLSALKIGVDHQILPEITRSLVGLVVISDNLDKPTALQTIIQHPACHWEAKHMAESLIGTNQAPTDAPQTSTTTLLDIAHQLGHVEI